MEIKDGTGLRKYLELLAEMSEQCFLANNPPNGEGQGRHREVWKYKSQEAFYLAEGHPFSQESLTDAEENLLRTLLLKRVYKPGECYYNAGQASLNSDGRLVFCEGFAMGRGLIPVHHGWLALNGKPIDVTWRMDATDKPTSRIDKLLVRINYNIVNGEYLGIEIPHDVFKKHIVTVGRWSPVVEGANYSFELLQKGIYWEKSNDNVGQEKGL